MKPRKSTRTPANSSDVGQVSKIIPPGGEIKHQEPPPVQSQELPPVAHRQVLRQILCPKCRNPLQTYCTQHRGTVTVRNHRCPTCGATSIQTREMAGVVQFSGWAGREIPRFSAN